MAITRVLLLGTLLTLIGTAFPALAATKHHHRVTHAHSAIYNMVPDTGCPANGGPSCSNAGPAAVEYTRSLPALLLAASSDKVAR